MDCKRITKNMIEVDGVIYMRYEETVSSVAEIKAHIIATLSRCGPLTKGVVVNRCRKWSFVDIEAAIKELLASGEMDGVCSVHPKTMMPVSHFSLVKP